MTMKNDTKIGEQQLTCRFKIDMNFTNDMRISQRHENFGKFSPEHLKVSKLGL